MSSRSIPIILLWKTPILTKVGPATLFHNTFFRNSKAIHKIDIKTIFLNFYSIGYYIKNIFHNEFRFEHEFNKV